MRDGLDLHSVQIHHSHDVRDWPVTATITRLDFRPTGVHVEHTKRAGPDRWPDFHVPGWAEGGEGLQYTLWIFLSIQHQWHAMGGIQFWGTCEENGGPPEQFAAGWYYDAGRWAPMTGHQPAPGELVGFMVSAGDARNNSVRTVDQRSNVIVIPFPRSGEVYMASPEDTPVSVPAVEPSHEASPVASHGAPGSELLVEALLRGVGVLEQHSAALGRLEATVATKADLAKLRQDVIDAVRVLNGATPGTAGVSVLERLLGRR
jgi:hypothetical protein